MSSFATMLLAVIYALFLLSLIISIAFYTVLERKVLAAVQRRRGPNLVGLWGLLQAFADGFKLLMKEPVFVSGANYYIFLSAPILLLAMSLSLWAFIPIPGFNFGISTSYSFVVVLLFSALNSYAIILAGLSSNSRYSLIGGVRAIAQLISYEMPLSVSLLTLFTIQGSFGLHDFAATKFIFAAMALPSLVIFYISLLAETNRTPFDLPEAEAELVAGYNLEYSSILFSLFFLAEYSNILLASSLLALLFFPGWFFFVAVILFALSFILVRAILPRYTFAQLINLCWCVMLPVSLFTFLATVGLMKLIGASNTDFINVALVDAISDMRGTDALIGLFCFGVASQAGDSAALPSKRQWDDLMLDVEQVPSRNIILFFIVALMIVLLLVGVNWVIINFRSNNKKNSPYECGFEPVGSPISDFSPNFLAVALVFLIFDVEVLLTYPWAYASYGRPFAAVFSLFIFVVMMLLGLAYEIIDESFKVV